MKVKFTSRSSGRVQIDTHAEFVKDFPRGSEYLTEPHWHVQYFGGFRMNVPKSLYDVVVMAK